MGQPFRQPVVFLAPVLAGCYLIGGPSDSDEGRSASLSIPAGVIDTVVIPGASALEVDNRAGEMALEITLESAVADPLSGTAVGGLIIRATPGSPGATAHLATGQPPTTIPARAFLAGPRQALPGESQIGVGHPDDPGTIFFWTEGTASHFVDPATGVARGVEAVELAIPSREPSAAFLRLAQSSGECSPALIDLDPTAPPGAVPVVLVHGWQAVKHELSGCDDFAEWLGAVSPFEDIKASLGETLAGVPVHQYAFRYNSADPIARNAGALRSAIAAELSSPPVIIAHSMGGLVARGAMRLAAAPEVRGLITIGTPHLGSPVVPAIGGISRLPSLFLAMDGCSGGFSSVLMLPLIVTFYPKSAGFDDMHPDGEFLREINTGHPGMDRIYALAGRNPSFGGVEGHALGFVECIIRRMGDDRETDGVVPIESALPAWAAGAHSVNGASHLEIPHDDRIISIVLDAVRRLTVCDAMTPPSIPSAFPISGSVSRRSPTEVAVTLNAILIDGVLQPPLSADQVRIVENGCAIPQDHVTMVPGNEPRGVDLVFLQDLSSSMSDVIVGVRNSVQAFAQALATSGVDVRLGAVGYSGAGTIPTSPPTSEEEFLGPVQDFTTPAVFSQHVAQQWTAFEGGDDPENGLEAIEYALDHLSWRPTAGRVFLDITDVGHHSATTSCNGMGPCTNHNLASILSLIAGRAVVHSVAPASSSARTRAGSLDPWLLAAGTGGKQIPLGSGHLDLMSLGLVDVLASSTTFTFRSASTTPAPENLRIIVTINGRSGEFRPGLVTYLRN